VRRLIVGTAANRRTQPFCLRLQGVKYAVVVDNLQRLSEPLHSVFRSASWPLAFRQRIKLLRNARIVRPEPLHAL
jgi:hypothetical protein